MFAPRQSWLHSAHCPDLETRPVVKTSLRGDIDAPTGTKKTPVSKDPGRVEGQFGNGPLWLELFIFRDEVDWWRFKERKPLRGFAVEARLTSADIAMRIILGRNR